MATDVERLVVSLEASITKYERAMQRALAQTNNTARNIEARFSKTQVRIGESFTNAGALIGKAFAGAAALRGAQVLIDTSTRVQNSLKVAGLEGEALSKVYDSLFASAQKNAAPIEALAQLYGRATLSQKDLKASSADLLKFTENVSLALRVNGASAEQSSGALLQLSQLLSAGTVRAEEFNSVQEGALPILQAAAAGLSEAGGSVAKLRSLVIDGKLSSAAFFAAFEAGSVILREKVAGSELTVSQSFIRLQNVLVDAAGKFDGATGASSRTGEALNSLAIRIEKIGNFFDENQQPISNFIEKLAEVNRLINSIPGIEKVINPVGSLIEAGDDLGAAADAFMDWQRASEAAAASIDQTQVALASLIEEALTLGASGAVYYTPEQAASLTALGRDLLAGKGDITAVKNVIEELARTNPDFSGIASQFQVIFDAATAASSAVGGLLSGSAGANIAGQRAEQNPFRAPPLPPSVKPVSITDYPVIPTSGTGKGSKSPGQKFQDDLDAQARRNENLRQETALQATLNPLVNDYGYAMEKLRVQQDLENDATKAGLELTPDRKAAIAELAEGYALATVEAQKLADAQDLARESMQEWFDLGRDAARGFIDDLVEGKSAAEALGNVFQKLGNKLLDMGLDSLFGTGSGSNPFGLIGKAFGFADGGIAKNGRPMKTFARGGVSNTAAIFGEGPMAEAAVPLPDGRRIPVDLRMPRMPAMPQAAAAGSSFTFAPTIDARGADVAAVARLEQVVARQSAEFDGRVRKIVASRAKDRW